MSLLRHRSLGWPGVYQSRNPRAATSPLRSMPFMRPAAEVLGVSWYAGRRNQPEAAPAPAAAPETIPAVVDPERELANAEASLTDAQRVYDSARREIGEANKTATDAIMCNGRVVMTPIPFTKERIRQRKSDAFKLFNLRRAQLFAGRRRVAAARVALGLPSLAAVAEREVVAAGVRASKQQPVGDDASRGAI